MVKALVIGTVPGLIAAGAARGENSSGASTQAVSQPATQGAEAQRTVAASDDGPLVIPDGTSLSNPGPRSNGTWQGETINIAGVRR